MKRTWTDVGAALLRRVRLEGPDGYPTRARISRAKVEAGIRGLRWRSVEGSHPASQGLAISAAIREFRIPKVDSVAYSSALAPYDLIGIQGHYTNGRARVYIVDTGSSLTPVASDFWSGEARNRIRYHSHPAHPSSHPVSRHHRRSR